MHDVFRHRSPADMYLITLLRLLNLTPLGAGSDHLPPGLLSQSGQGRSFEDVPLHRLCALKLLTSCITDVGAIWRIN